MSSLSREEKGNVAVRSRKRVNDDGNSRSSRSLGGAALMTVSPISRPDGTWVWHEFDGNAVRAEQASSVDVAEEESPEGLRIIVRADEPVAQVALRWNRPVPSDSLVVGDAWERSYGDLEWSGIRPHHPLPWYWAATSGSTRTTWGAGVRVRPVAMSSWTVDVSGFTLWLDLRSGMTPVLLSGRALHAATVVELDSERIESSFAAITTLVAARGDDALPVSRPVFGANNR